MSDGNSQGRNQRKDELGFGVVETSFRRLELSSTKSNRIAVEPTGGAWLARYQLSRTAHRYGSSQPPAERLQELFVRNEPAQPCTQEVQTSIALRLWSILALLKHLVSQLPSYTHGPSKQSSRSRSTIGAQPLVPEVVPFTAEQ
ncbi:uncharacterized protein CIMG_09397 [Coccidioides immitis RS]|uniref:Uncharacterized protein n=1 Tax=Coccidioides immitis (strain RS) TaxID=246410 RepID=J3K294_COCIM|nr:uncharacterized protein CIMG_09397 [Coccidioides immitis RS]EAS28193.3 hypothetical protein CIMG_09397 [Coccidioides immitis RS]